MANYYYGHITLHGPDHILSAISNSLLHMEDIIQEHYPQEGVSWIPGILKHASDFDNAEPRIFYDEDQSLSPGNLEIQYYGLNTSGEAFWQKFCQMLHLDADLSWADEVEEDTDTMQITGNTGTSVDVDSVLYQTDES